jgi:hypothetical protein
MPRRPPALIAIAVLAAVAAETPPPSPPSRRAAAAGAKVLDIPDDLTLKTPARPALRRQDARRNLKAALSSADDADTAVSATEEEAEAPTAPPRRDGVMQQIIVLVVVLVVRVGLAFLKVAQARAQAAGGPPPFAGFNTMLLNSPLGPALKLVQRGWAAVAELARSPQSAPLMMGLLIIATKLVARADGRASAFDTPIEDESAVVMEEEEEGSPAAEREDEEEVEEVEEVEEDDDE